MVDWLIDGLIIGRVDYWMVKAAASWLWASLSSTLLHRCKAAVAGKPIHQMYSHGHVAADLQRLHISAER